MSECLVVGRRKNRFGNTVEHDKMVSQASRSETPEEGELLEDGDGHLLVATEGKLRHVENGDPEEGDRSRGGRKRKKRKKNDGRTFVEDNKEIQQRGSEMPEEGQLLEDGDGQLLRAATGVSQPESKDAEEGDEGDREKKRKNKKKKKKGTKGNCGIEEDEKDQHKTRGKKRPKENQKRRKIAIMGDELSYDHTKGNSGKIEVVQMEDGDVVAEESLTMRKLLRGPRYFDPEEEQGQSCFNCGKVGHIAAACADNPRLRPCYVCGGFGHEGRECPQGTKCYVCGAFGHIAKSCPNKGSGVRYGRGELEGSGILYCLLCGHSGHETSTCFHAYDSRDLEQVQCYVCKKFGHLCCVVIIDSKPVPVSCFNCGEMGHTGIGCALPRNRSNGSRDMKERGPATSSVCFKCGEEGHYARGCSKRYAPWPPEEQGFAGDSSRRHQSRNVGRAPRWMDSPIRETPWTPSPRRINTGRSGRTPSGVLASKSVRSGDAPDMDAAKKSQDTDYMGPIGNFVDPPKEGYYQRRKRSWTSTAAR